MNIIRKVINKSEEVSPAEVGAKTESAQLFINGEWRVSSDKKTFTDINPATRQPYAEVADGTVADMDAAIDAAYKAQPAWAALPPAARASFLHKAVAIFEANQENFANALVQETGSGLGKAMFECSLIPLAFREAAALTTHPIGETYPSNVPGKINRVERTAAGVVGVISPWNFPLYLSLRGFVYAIALGNTAVLKPSEDSPLTGGTMLAELFEAAGLPAGVFNVVCCRRENVKAVAAKMIDDPRVARISFTGSTLVGRDVGVACAAQLKRAILEMGGKNPVVVLEDADLDYAVNSAFFSAFLHQGQICMSADKIIVARKIYEPFVKKLTEKVSVFKPLEPSNPMSVIGPIINDRQLNRIERMVKAAKAAGATIHTGGEKEGPFFQGTVITGVKSDMEIYQEEIFGPVALVIPADSEDEAIKIANDTKYGLSAAIITNDREKGELLAPRIQAGMVHVNDTCVHDEPHCPFGGTKSSGWVGKWGGAGAIEAFTEQRWISVQVEPRQYPF